MKQLEESGVFQFSEVKISNIVVPCFHFRVFYFFFVLEDFVYYLYDCFPFSSSKSAGNPWFRQLVSILQGEVKQVKGNPRFLQVLLTLIQLLHGVETGKVKQLAAI